MQALEESKSGGGIFLGGDSLYCVGLYLISVSFDFSINGKWRYKNMCLSEAPKSIVRMNRNKVGGSSLSARGNCIL